MQGPNKIARYIIIEEMYTIVRNRWCYKIGKVLYNNAARPRMMTMMAEQTTVEEAEVVVEVDAPVVGVPEPPVEAPVVLLAVVVAPPVVVRVAEVVGAVLPVAPKAITRTTALAGKAAPPWEEKTT